MKAQLKYLPPPKLIRTVEVELGIDHIISPLSISCVFTHYHEFPGTRSEPAEGETVDLHAAYVAGTDVLIDPILTPELRAHVEELLLDEIRG